MSILQEIHVDDTGTIFELTFKDGTVIVDISLSISQTILFQDPTGITTSKTADFVTDGTDGKIQHKILAPTLLTTAGIWKIQGRLIFTGGGDWHSSIHEFQVFENL